MSDRMLDRMSDRTKGFTTFRYLEPLQLNWTSSTLKMRNCQNIWRVYTRAYTQICERGRSAPSPYRVEMFITGDFGTEENRISTLHHQFLLEQSHHQASFRLSEPHFHASVWGKVVEKAAWFTLSHHYPGSSQERLRLAWPAQLQPDGGHPPFVNCPTQLTLISIFWYLYFIKNIKITNM